MAGHCRPLRLGLQTVCSTIFFESALIKSNSCAIQATMKTAFKTKAGSIMHTGGMQKTTQHVGNTCHDVSNSVD